MNRSTTPSGLGTAHAGEPGLAAGHARTTPALRLVPPRARIRADTTPLPAPRATFETRRLVAVDAERLELVPTWQERAFLGVLFGFAAALAAIGASRFGTGALSDALAVTPAMPSAWPPILAAAVLALVAVAVARAGGRTVLDSRTRQFSRSGGARLDRIDFDELVGVQRLACRIADEEVSWTIHQVNLVMRDGSRTHVCSHVEEALARRTAETLARFVGVQVLSSSAAGDGGGSRDATDTA